MFYQILPKDDTIWQSVSSDEVYRMIKNLELLWQDKTRRAFVLNIIVLLPPINETLVFHSLIVTCTLVLH